ncbi:MAG: ABC transporter permease subunit [Phycisphaerales bacterium JB038]
MSDCQQKGEASSGLRRKKKLQTPLSAYGEPMVWLTGGSLGVCVVMVAGLLLLVLWAGMTTFWPASIRQVELADGRLVMGEVTRSEWYQPQPGAVEDMPAAVAERARRQLETKDGKLLRELFRTGNFDLTNLHFVWVNDVEVKEEALLYPEWAMSIERIEWGRFIGFPQALVIDAPLASREALDAHAADPGATVEALVEGEYGNAVAKPISELTDEDLIVGVRETLAGPELAWRAYQQHHEEVRQRWRQRRKLEKHDLGETARLQERARLQSREVELDRDLPTAWALAYREWHEAKVGVQAGKDWLQDQLDSSGRRLARFHAANPLPEEDVAAFQEALDRETEVKQEAERHNLEILAEIRSLNEENERYRLVMQSAQGVEKVIPLAEIVRAYPANQLGAGGKFGVYLSRWWEFLTDEPREANAEGGVYPAIIGTVLMTIIMALLVVPFGVMAALYLREYAKAGPIVSAVRIAINNLAGVPSIVYGVFGLGFFCYGVGSFIDGGPSYAMPKPIWFVILIGAVLVAAGAFAATIMSVSKPGMPRSLLKRVMRLVSVLLWLSATVGALLLIGTTPFFDGFFRAGLPNPTFGKGALIWASFTLALLTLPVVIVATEEALAAVPNSMREGSYACGGSKWQTIQRIVLPRAMPGIMTGTILAMARGAGEVAPLMLVGAVKVAAELPVSASPAEHFGINRSFMHLGFHIYDLGFQSQNSEASKPLVFTTTLLLITIVAALNIAAVFLRSRLRRKFVGAKF